MFKSTSKTISLPELVAAAGNGIMRLTFRSLTTSAPEKCGTQAENHIRHEFAVYPKNEGPHHSIHRRIGNTRNHLKEQIQYVLLTGVTPTADGVMIAASPWRPQQPFLRSDECDQVNNHRRSVSSPMSGQGGVLRVRDAPPADIFLLLLAGDVETNVVPCFYACGKNFRRTDAPIACLRPARGTQTHKQIRCSVLRS